MWAWEREIKWIYKIKREVSERSRLFSLISDKGDSCLSDLIVIIFGYMTSSFYVEQLIGEFSAEKCMEHPPKNKGRADVILDPDTYHDRDENERKMRTLIETGLYFYDPVDNNLICFSFASLSRFGIS